VVDFSPPPRTSRTRPRRRGRLGPAPRFGPLGTSTFAGQFPRRKGRGRLWRLVVQILRSVPTGRPVRQPKSTQSQPIQCRESTTFSCRCRTGTVPEAQRPSRVIIAATVSHGKIFDRIEPFLLTPESKWTTTWALWKAFHSGDGRRQSLICNGSGGRVPVVISMGAPS
jgi:hypothetical protein